ncbi:MAG: hypothetical protein IJT07_04535 [Oscillospiraceae bacterium]|nr:hypothetical protein [Oscillospiraceae bacterium]
MKKIILLVCIVILAALLALFAPRIVAWLFSSQYNANGVSHFLVITIDKDQPKTYVGKLEDHDVYLEGLSADETVFRSVNAENITLEEAFAKNLVSIGDWRKYA